MSFCIIYTSWTIHIVDSQSIFVSYKAQTNAKSCSFTSRKMGKREAAEEHAFAMRSIALDQIDRILEIAKRI